MASDDTTTTTNNFIIRNIYLKDASFEAPNTPHIFSIQWEPKVDFDLNANSQTLTDTEWETLLDVTVRVNVSLPEEQRAKNDGKESVTAFIVEVKVAGIFTIVGFEKDVIEKILAIDNPTILFPYLREIVASLVQKGGFPPLILPPIAFEDLYKKHLAEANAEANVEANNANSPIELK